MPRYFFDVQAGTESGSDPRGVDLAGEREARREALLRALRAFERDCLDGDRSEVTVHVRDGDRGAFVVRLAASVSPPDPRGDGLRPDQLNSGNDV